MTGINQMPILRGCLKSFPKPVLFALLAALLMTGCATQDDLLVVYNRVITLEGQQKEATADREQMRSRLDESISNMEMDVTKLREDLAEMRVNTNSLRNEVRTINGLMEEQGYQLRSRVGSAQTTGGQAQEHAAILEARVESLEKTLLKMESYLGMEGKTGEVPAPAQTEAEAAPVPAKELDEDQAYAQAKKDFDEMRLEKARDGFKNFLARFPNSSKADNALFWMGETFFKEKWYEKAILQYQDVIEKHPKANKVPAAYFKQGLAFSMLGDNSNAKLIWTELIRKFPNSAEAGWAQKKLDAL
ncbi:tol-pal system protein YbgF [Desulfatibacillum alkenivorans DSM 16219]|uniref:Tol-pal system protein YbgF n=1 Tax=Desulfatibacillum alkenivorans DSM 16219 TaxID=1121393 RepID=A0A1M6DZ75_9BACT|nr:tol-pal system protein YbgF [Desulfatibacillum alkenivorans]SHI78552.1 tol-pal system protein YbgF [Desulfatibacillum alkenivorans DSM 16219]